MKAHLKVLFTFSIFILITSCTKDNNKGDEFIFGGQLTNSTTCKDFTIKSSSDFTADTISKIEYEYNSATHTLELKHVNAGFNCCPIIISSQFSLNGNTILIEEEEEAADCHCNCLYDLGFKITGIAQKTYKISIEEPYAGSMPKLEFEINLLQETSGSISVIRKTYPWGVSVIN